MGTRTLLRFLAGACVLAVGFGPGCEPEPPPPAGPEACESPVDSDGDGRLGCERPECAQRPDCRGVLLPPSTVGTRVDWILGPEGHWRAGTRGAELGDQDGDGLPDLATFRVSVQYSGPWEERPPYGTNEEIVELSRTNEVWVLPSQAETRARMDSEALGVRLATVEPNNQMIPGAFDCDLDGDGFDDILIREVGAYPWEGVRRNWVRVGYGSPTLAQDRQFERVVSLSWPGEGLNGVECGDDIDGDGRDDATVRTEQDGTFWLDLAAAVDGEPLENYARRRWSEPVRPIGDINGDGYGDLRILCCAWSPEVIERTDELLVDLVVPGGPAFVGTDPERRSITVDAPEGAQFILEDGPWHASNGHCCDVEFYDLDGDNRPELVLSADSPSAYVWPSAMLGDLRSQIRLSAATVLGATSAFGGYTHGFRGTGDLNGDGEFEIVTRGAISLVPGTYSQVPDVDDEEGRWAAVIPAVYGGPLSELLLDEDPAASVTNGILWPYIKSSSLFPDYYVGTNAPALHISPDRDGDGTDDILIIGCCALTEEQSADPNYLPLGVVVYGADLFPPETSTP